MKKPPYREGSCFSIPLQDGGYALGVVARVGRSGGLIVYLFGPRHATLDEFDCAQELNPNEALARIRCGDLRLVRGEWKVVGQLSKWKREEWPVPLFFWQEEGTDRAWLIEYHDDDITKIKKEIPISPQKKGYDKNSLYGAAAVEALATKLLSS